MVGGSGNATQVTDSQGLRDATLLNSHVNIHSLNNKPALQYKLCSLHLRQGKLTD